MPDKHGQVQTINACGGHITGVNYSIDQCNLPQQISHVGAQRAGLSIRGTAGIKSLDLSLICEGVNIFAMFGESEGIIANYVSNFYVVSVVGQSIQLGSSSKLRATITELGLR